MTPEKNAPSTDADRTPLSPKEKGLLVEGSIGGFLMGLANLVPGISGGTMLLAVGVYPRFIGAVAEVSTFRFRLRSILLLATVVAGAALAIAGLAGVVKGLVIDHRWIMYSLFIGLTLGGVPVVWRMVRPINGVVVIAATIGLAGMLALSLAESGGGPNAGEGHNYVLLVLAGIAGGAAMILPGVSGAYLLIVLGQYLVILGAISSARHGVTNGDWNLVGDAMHVFIPVGIGVVVGVVGVSNVMKILLTRHPKATLGVLLGLLVGAVAGLWPFQQPRMPVVGDVVRGIEMTSIEQIETTEREHWPTETFSPMLWQIGAGLGLVVLGFGASVAVSRMAPEEDSSDPALSGG